MAIFSSFDSAAKSLNELSKGRNQYIELGFICKKNFSTKDHGVRENWITAILSTKRVRWKSSEVSAKSIKLMTVSKETIYEVLFLAKAEKEGYDLFTENPLGMNLTDPLE